MKVREFFENFNPQLAGQTNLYMRDVRSNTVRTDTVEIIMRDDGLHEGWKNANICSWSITEYTVVLTVEKEAE